MRKRKSKLKPAHVMPFEKFRMNFMNYLYPHERIAAKTLKDKQVFFLVDLLMQLEMILP